jgi:hypothetical protein
MRWRLMWLGVAVLVAVVAGGSLAWFTHQKAGPPAAAARTTRVVRPPAPPLTTGRAIRLLARLTSGNSSEVASVIAMPSGEQVPASAVRGMRTLAPVTADAGSFRIVSSALATMSVTDRTGTKWLLHLIPVHGAWRVLDSVKQ